MVTYKGVFFRAYVSEKAAELELTGYVRNLPGGQDVEVRAEGERDKLEQLVDYLKVGPSAARVDGVTTNWSKHTGEYSRFIIKY
jgi:acylphosphatase